MSTNKDVPLEFSSNTDEVDPKVEAEIKKTQNTMEFQTKALDRLKTIKTGKRKILDIFRQNANVMDKGLMQQLNERYNDFCLQEAEIFEILKHSMGSQKDDENSVNETEVDPEVTKIKAQIAEINSKLAQVKAKNVELELQAQSKDLTAAKKKRDELSKKVLEVQQSNVQKKQVLNKIITENPDLVAKNSEKNGNNGPDLDACMSAMQTTPGTSKEFDEIAQRFENLKMRKDRIHNIKERLAQATSTQKMDETYHAALNRLESLNAIRKVLEESTNEADNFIEENGANDDDTSTPQPDKVTADEKK